MSSAALGTLLRIHQSDSNREEDVTTMHLVVVRCTETSACPRPSADEKSLFGKPQKYVRSTVRQGSLDESRVFPLALVIASKELPYILANKILVTLEATPLRSQLPRKRALPELSDGAFCRVLTPTII